MAQWSQAAADKKKAEKLVITLAERKDLFATFREGGWKINVIDPEVTQEYALLKDNAALAFPHFLIKMPGSFPMRIKTVEQLRRLVRGVS
jgi:hypothetical protein